MKRSRFTEDQMIGIPRKMRPEFPWPTCAASSAVNLCGKHDVSDAAVYGWKAKYGGKDVGEVKQLKGLEDENTRLKLLLADAMLGKAALKNLLGRNWSRPPQSSKRSLIFWKPTG